MTISGSQSRRIGLKGHKILRSRHLSVHLKFHKYEYTHFLESDTSIEDELKEEITEQKLSGN